VGYAVGMLNQHLEYIGAPEVARLAQVSYGEALDGFDEWLDMVDRNHDTRDLAPEEPSEMHEPLAFESAFRFRWVAQLVGFVDRVLTMHLTRFCR